MKFARNAPAVGRAAVSERQRRDRAAAPVLRTRYPDLLSLKLDFEFDDQTAFLPSPLVTVIHPPARAYFCFACPYSDCDGEFNLTSAVAQMVGARETVVEDKMRCSGTRRGGVPCTLCLEYTLTASW